MAQGIGQSKKRKADDAGLLDAKSDANQSTAQVNSATAAAAPQIDDLSQENFHAGFSLGGVKVQIDSMQGKIKNKEKPQRQDGVFAYRIDRTEKIYSKEIGEQVLKDTCERLSKDIDEQKSFVMQAGSTLTLGILYRLDNNQLMLSTAQIGDSSAKLMSATDQTVSTLTTAFNCNNKSEAAKFQAKGGVISKNRVGGMLAILTSLGHPSLRKLYGLTADAEIKSTVINPNDKVMAATDGADFLGDQGIEKYFSDAKNEESGLCEFAREHEKNHDDTAFVQLTNLSAIGANDLVVFGVFDGNGKLGHSVAAYGNKQLPVHLNAAIKAVPEVANTAAAAAATSPKNEGAAVAALIAVKKPKVAAAASATSVPAANDVAPANVMK